MIHFKKQLCKEAEQLLKIKDNFDLAKDFSDIKNNMDALENYPTLENTIVSATHLNAKLRNKYPTIDAMINIGSKMANVLALPSQQPLMLAESLKSELEQDYFGIFCHALIKENAIQRIDQFIDFID